MSTTPREHQDRAITALLRLLETRDGLDPEVMEARADLAEATARAGQIEDALKQAEALWKDARREHGEDHPVTARSKAAFDAVIEIAS